MDITNSILDASKGHKLYDVRKEEYKNETSPTGFRVSPTPYKLTKEQKEEMLAIGKAICSYMDACIELYHSKEHVRELLDRGKPEKYKNAKNPRYLFLRPDLILTENGFSICEIETSPFGLGLAEILNRAYGNCNFNPIVTQNELKNYMQTGLPQKGTIAYSDKVKAFGGQLDFLAEEVISGDGKKWDSKNISLNQTDNKEIYRAFYLSEELKDPKVAEFLQEPHIYLPSQTPQFEEKALMAFIWDTRYKAFFEKHLGKGEFELLRKAIPKTWIIGEEEFVDGGLPEGKKDSIEVAGLSRSKRRFVSKESGFNIHSSWGEGVKFLHRLSGKKAVEDIKTAMNDKNHLYIMQEFRPGQIVNMTYFDQDENGHNIFKNMNARIRITPYFAYTKKNKGKMIAVKVTGCEPTTDYIHAGTHSINTAVEEER